MERQNDIPTEQKPKLKEKNQDPNKTKPVPGEKKAGTKKEEPVRPKPDFVENSAVGERLDTAFAALGAWYGREKRILPWRQTKDPYRIWISEIMLQQTRVETVIPYYERFLEQFPDLESLARADEVTLLKLWEGLGYYTRARNLKKAACFCVERGWKNLPGTAEELLLLPGIGGYTAGAVASIAYGEKCAAVDGNVLRVVSRILASRKDISDPGVKGEFDERIGSVMKTGVRSRSLDPGEINQSLMELGACVCIPNGAPHCGGCPAASCCLAYELGLTEELPVRSAKKKRRIEERTVFILTDGERIVLHRRDRKGLLSGLYELPGTEGFPDPDEIRSFWKNLLSADVSVFPAESGKHIFTHVEWHMKGCWIRTADPLIRYKEQLEQSGLILADLRDVRGRYPIPGAFKTWKRYWEA